MSRYVLFLLVLLVSVLYGGCGPRDGGGGIPVAFHPGANEERVLGDTVPVSGVFQFEDIVVSSAVDGSGAQAATVTKPCRFLDVVALDPTTMEEVQVGTSATDENGAYTMQVRRNTPFLIGLRASTRASSSRVNLEVRDDPLANNVYDIVVLQSQSTSGPFSLGANILSLTVSPFLITILPADQRPAGACNILDAGLVGSDAIRNANGGAAPPLVTFYWRPDLDIGTFFARTLGPGGGPAIAISGGDSDTGNTDEFDDGVIQHEYGHFIAFSFSRDSSRGGQHTITDKHYASLAYSEGLANFLSCNARNFPIISDLARITGATVIATFSVETGTHAAGAAGIEYENTVGEVLWDLADGPQSLLDVDADGQTVFFSAIFLTMKNLAVQSPPPYVSLITFLNALVNTGAITATNVQSVLDSPFDQLIDFSPGPQPVFPTPITVNGATLSDSCETRIQTGDVKFTASFDSNKFFIFTLAARTTIQATMSLTGTIGGNPVDGSDGQGTNIDMNLLTVNNAFAIDAFTSSQLTPAASQQLTVETATGTLNPGTYVIYVHGRADTFNPAGAGALTNSSSNAVSFDLSLISL